MHAQNSYEPFVDSSESLPDPSASDNEQRLIQLEHELSLDKSELFALAEAALRRLNGVPATSAHVACWILIARWHFYAAELKAVDDCSAMAVNISARVDDPLMRVKALKMRTAALSESGDLDESIAVQLQALEAAKRIKNSDKLVAGLLNNLGITLQHTARFSAAYECLRHAAELFPTPTIWVNLSFLFLDVGEVGSGLETAQRASAMLETLETQKDRLTRAHLDLCLTLLLVRVGDFAQAKAHAVRAIERSEQAGKRAQWLTQLGRLLIDAHDPAKASAAIESLLTEVRGTDPWASHHRTYCDVVVAAMQAAGRPFQAMEFLNEMARVDGEYRARNLRSAAAIQVPQEALVYDALADAQLRDRQKELQEQTQKMVWSRSERLQRLIDIAIRAELREEEPFSDGQHAYRVARLAELIGSQVNCSNDEILAARLTGLLHDLGKVYISDTLLTKQAPLTDFERQVFKRRTDDGAQLIESLGDPALAAVASAIRHLSESAGDGLGYPSALEGQSIPIVARIVAVCSAFDAYERTRRPYRRAWDHADALKQLDDAAGTLYDPTVTRALIALINRLKNASEELDVQLAVDGKKSRVVLRAANAAAFTENWRRSCRRSTVNSICRISRTPDGRSLRRITKHFYRERRSPIACLPASPSLFYAACIRVAPIRHASANAFCMAPVLAMPRPAMSYAVPCAGVVMEIGRPPGTVTPLSNPISFIAI